MHKRTTFGTRILLFAFSSVLLATAVFAAPLDNLFSRIGGFFGSGSSASETTGVAWYDANRGFADFAILFFLFFIIFYIGLNTAGKKWKEAGVGRALVALSVILALITTLSAIKFGMTASFLAPYFGTVLFTLLTVFLYHILTREMFLGDKRKILAFVLALLLAFLLTRAAVAGSSYMGGGGYGSSDFGGSYGSGGFFSRMFDFGGGIFNPRSSIPTTGWDSTGGDTWEVGGQPVNTGPTDGTSSTQPSGDSSDSWWPSMPSSSEPGLWDKFKERFNEKWDQALKGEEVSAKDAPLKEKAEALNDEGLKLLEEGKKAEEEAGKVAKTDPAAFEQKKAEAKKLYEEAEKKFADAKKVTGDFDNSNLKRKFWEFVDAPLKEIPELVKKVKTLTLGDAQDNALIAQIRAQMDEYDKIVAKADGLADRKAAKKMYDDALAKYELLEQYIETGKIPTKRGGWWWDRKDIPLTDFPKITLPMKFNSPDAAARSGVTGGAVLAPPASGLATGTVAQDDSPAKEKILEELRNRKREIIDKKEGKSLLDKFIGKHVGDAPSVVQRVVDSTVGEDRINWWVALLGIFGLGLVGWGAARWIPWIGPGLSRVTGLFSAAGGFAITSWIWGMGRVLSGLWGVLTWYPFLIFEALIALRYLIPWLWNRGRGGGPAPPPPGPAVP